MSLHTLLSPGGATEVKQDTIITALAAIVAELQQKLEAGQAVALDSSTLTALENVTSTIANFPTDYPDDAAAVLLNDIKTALEGTVTVDATNLDIRNLDAQQDNVVAYILNLPGNVLDVQGTVSLSTASLAALESINATIQNWPSEFPLPASQVAELTPQTDGLTDSELRASPVPVSGTVSVSEPVTVDGTVAVNNLPTPQTDALTDTELRASPVPVDDGHPDPQTDGLTDTQLRATPVPVSGTVSVSEPVTVDGTVDVGNLPTPQTDALTDAQLRATPVPVDIADASITVEIPDEVDIGNFPTIFPDGHDQPLTDTELRATPVPVSGTVSVNEPVTVDGVQTDALTDTELRANPVPISGTVSVAEPVTVDGSVSVTNFPPSVEISNDSGSPIPITGTVTASGASLNVSEALNFTSHNLLTSALSLTTDIANDYQADGLELHFTTAAKRTITLTSEDGTVIRKWIDNTNLDLNIDLEKKYFEGGENLTLAITQTAAACSVTGKLTVAQGELSLAGSPIVEIQRPVVVRDLNAFYNVRGQRYIATTGYVPNTLNTTTELIALLRNPSGSGQVFVLDKAEFGATADTRFSRFGGGTSSIVGGQSPQPIGRTDGGTSTSTMELYIGGNGGGSPVRANQISSATGGTLRKVAAMKGYEAYQLNDIRGTVILQPGQQAYWRVDESPGGGGGTFYTYIDFEWWEVPTAEWALMVASMQSRPVY